VVLRKNAGASSPPWDDRPSKFASAGLSDGPKANADVMPARQAYSHSASVGSR
jgi:hypothetical protein